MLNQNVDGHKDNPTSFSEASKSLVSRVVGSTIQMPLEILPTYVVEGQPGGWSGTSQHCRVLLCKWKGTESVWQNGANVLDSIGTVVIAPSDAKCTLIPPLDSKSAAALAFAAPASCALTAAAFSVSAFLSEAAAFSFLWNRLSTSFTAWLPWRSTTAANRALFVAHNAADGYRVAGAPTNIGENWST